MRIHSVNGLPYLLFPATSATLTIPIRDTMSGTFDLTRQKYFSDPITKLPLYTVDGTKVTKCRAPELMKDLSDNMLRELLMLEYTKTEDPKQEIKAIQNHPFFRYIVHDSPHRGTINGLYEIVEQMTAHLSYGDGKALESIMDCLTKGYRFVCGEVTAIVAACIDGWNVPLRLGLGFGENITFTHEEDTYNYFMDDEPGFGPSLHCWIELYLNNEWIIFDPTIYFNKVRSKPKPALLEKYREVAIQKNIHSGLYQFIQPDFMKFPYHKNFTKTLFMLTEDEMSVQALAELFQTTFDILHVHRLITNPKDTEAHIKTTRALQYCQSHFRPFVYTESKAEALADIMMIATQIAETESRGHPFDRIYFNH